MCQDEKRSDKRTTNVVDIRAKNTASQKIVAIEQIAHEIELNRLSQTAFLDAWKDGIALIGETHFVITSSSVVEANDKFQLCPDFEILRQSLGVLSGGERRFLIGMCQFYSDSGVANLCHQLGINIPSLADLALLDEKHRSILVRLLNSYTGW